MDKVVDDLEFSTYGDLDFSILQEITELLEQQEPPEADDPYMDNPKANARNEIKTKCKNKSKKFPSLKNNPTLWMFVQQVAKEIGELRTKANGPSELKMNQLKALKNLGQKHNIIAKPSDKGGNVVLMNTDNYEKMCFKIFNNKS